MKRFKQIIGTLMSLEAQFAGALKRRDIMRLIIIGIVFFAASMASAEEKVLSGTIDIDETQLGYIIGGDIGKGTLHYQGADYHFKTGGIKVGGVGITKIAAAGEVYNLFDISQFPGIYVEGDYGIALGGGVGGTVLKNEHGVYMRLHSTLQGVALAFGVEGLHVKDVELAGADEEEPVEQVEVKQEAAQTYTVQSGNTLNEIADMYGTTVSAIKSANNLTSDTIFVGQVLVIPQ